MDIVPEGYIDVSALLPPPRKTLKADIEAILKRFGKQRFCSKHVHWALREEEYYRKRDQHSLYCSVRTRMVKLAKLGDIEIVSRGKPGVSSVYRNRNIEESEKQADKRCRAL